MLILLQSCLKQSIADAMMDDKEKAHGVATMTYEVNGNAVKNSVNDPRSQSPTGYQIGCSKYIYPGTNSTVYSLDFLSTSGELSFIFYTDSLRLENYLYPFSYGEMYFASYNGTNQYVHDPADSLSFTITSYSKGQISGNFSGRLTPVIEEGEPNRVYGAGGSTLITKGSFKDVPVFY